MLLKRNAPHDRQTRERTVPTRILRRNFGRHGGVSRADECPSAIGSHAGARPACGARAYGRWGATLCRPLVRVAYPIVRSRLGASSVCVIAARLRIDCAGGLDRFSAVPVNGLPTVVASSGSSHCT